jgi:hypothetical protein
MLSTSKTQKDVDETPSFSTKELPNYNERESSVSPSEHSFDTENTSEYLEIPMNKNNIDFYNENVFNELGITTEITIVFTEKGGNNKKSKRKRKGGGEEYTKVTVPYRYFYSGLSNISNLFVFSKPANVSSSGVLSRFYSFFTSSTPRAPPVTDKREGFNFFGTTDSGKYINKANSPSENETNKANSPSENETNKANSPRPDEDERPKEFVGKLSDDTPFDPQAKIRIKLNGEVQDSDCSYFELIQERLWIEKAFSMKKFFMDYDIYKINEKIILIGNLLSFDDFDDFHKNANDISENMDVETKVRIYELNRFNKLYPHVLEQLINTELYKLITFGTK